MYLTLFIIIDVDTHINRILIFNLKQVVTPRPAFFIAEKVMDKAQSKQDETKDISSDYVHWRGGIFVIIQTKEEMGIFQMDCFSLIF